MLPSSPADPGFLAVSSAAPGGPAADVAAVAAAAGATEPRRRSFGGTTVATWGLQGLAAADDGEVAYALGRGARRDEADLSAADLHRLLGVAHRDELVDVLPPFAAVAVPVGNGDGAGDGTSAGAVVAATDVLGARHLYHARGDGWVAASTSPQALAALTRAGVDRDAVAVQSLLGWQLGTRSMFAGVTKLEAGSTMALAGGELRIERYAPEAAPPPQQLDQAVRAAATMLREYLEAYLDDHPDARLQLTGGQDSRLLLSAIPPARRKGLTAMTLSVPGSDDVPIAADLVRRFGMRHEVVTLDGLEGLAPAEAHTACVSAARRLGCSADPLAFASLTFAEAKIEQGPRLSGLGGEVARGFYYFGPAVSMPVNRRATDVLAAWRMFANESVTADVVEPDFAAAARRFTLGEIFDTLAATGLPWLEATDEFYLWQRMQRWAGVTDTAVAFDREVVNPMLDRRFLDIARGLPPRAKRSSRFLSRLQVALDPELAAIPLDGRPAPDVYATRSVANTVTLASLTAGKVVRKGRQKLQRSRKAPAGGNVLAAKVVQHWRDEPAVLDALRGLGIVREPWLRDLVAGTTEPQPGAVAFVTNLLVAADATAR